MKRLVTFGDTAFFLGLCVYCLWHYRPDWQYLTCMIVAIVSMALWFTARAQLGESFAVMPGARELVTTGLYSKLRNPIYVFGGVAPLSLCLAMRWYVAFAVLLVIEIAVQWRRAGAEAKVLEAKFGDEYRQYRARTWF